MKTRIYHIALLLRFGPRILFSQRLQKLLREAMDFSKSLPERLSAPLPKVMDALEQERTTAPKTANETELRSIADLAAALDRYSPLGICLRRSLTRYMFLGGTGLPLEVNFGARFKEGTPDRTVTGHAWITVDGEPYYEDNENYRDFTVMMKYPMEGK